MTIILAVKDRMLSDSLVDDDGLRSFMPKIFVSHKAIIGGAGDYKHIRRFCAWYVDRRKTPPAPADEFEALVWTPKNGLEFWDNDLEPQPVLDPIYAIGSGREGALCAVAAGASPKEALEAVCKVYTSCAPPIVEILLSKKTLLPKRSKQ